MKPEISKVTSARHAAVPVLLHVYTDFKHIIWPHKTFNFTVDMQLLRADWKRSDRGVHDVDIWVEAKNGGLVER